MKLKPPVPAKTREQLMDERAAADFARMDQINGQPLPLDLLRAESWHGMGGSAGFSWDGQDI
jgi:hypothetical protein